MTGEIASTALGGAGAFTPTATANVQNPPHPTEGGGYSPVTGQPPVFTRSTGSTGGIGGITQDHLTGAVSGYGSAPQLASLPAGLSFGGTAAQGVAGWSRAPVATHQVPAGPMGHVAIDMPYASAPQLAAPGTPSIGSVGDVVLDLHSSSPVHGLLHGYFTPYMNIANQHQFHELIDDRTRVLHAMGHDAERVARNLDKANQFDWYTTAAVGGVKASPFALATYFMDMYPQLLAAAQGRPAAEGALAGTIAGASDVVGTAMATPAIVDTRWLQAGMGDLVPPMQQAVQERQPEFMQQLLQNMALLQPYTGRNVVRTATAPVMEMWGGRAVRSAVDTGLACVGGIAAGAATEAMARGFYKYNGLDGPALLFGRQDWEQIYRDLDAATWSGQTANGFERAARMPGDVVTGVSDLAQAIARPSTGAEIGLLAGGFAAIETARSVVGTGVRAAGYGEPVVQAASHAVNTVMAAPLYAALIPAMTGANRLGAAAAQSLHENDWTNRRPVSGAAVLSQSQTVPIRQLSIADSDVDNTDDPSLPLTGGVHGAPGVLPFGRV